MDAGARKKYDGNLPLPFLRQFDRMVPEIRRHVRRAKLKLGVVRPELLTEEVVIGAFEVYASLANRGLSDLAYPKPLAMTALEQLSIRKPR